MRLFVAAYPPPEVCDDLGLRLEQLKVTAAASNGVNTRLARRETWHVTLAFLGEVPDDRAGDVPGTLQRVADGWRTAGSAAPQLRLAGGGRFGRGRYTVLWVGVDGDRDALTSLSRRVRRELKRDRLPFDDRRFNPHLTVARPGDRLAPAEVEADRAELAGYRGPAWRVKTMVLVRSHLGPTPRYEHLGAWPLD
ncbi:RNA 2',3'-cyclic phosphodiesterase [Actinoplanes sp. KI2]|uniref:RNA 2',3'-cyclic phosphodiesterase n=1 Tax=Actinoplanes sp. KI2 TaxID=2983315 RepID=UPI0021D5D64A|nr:RNA 2',3'-cyclic phosphodiesterase [Actinoplanes sp. KI2]MCU7728355.1 RNA 2',3'-cyclic phosphodiesterase [Actinoplanes sp. KI2]